MISQRADDESVAREFRGYTAVELAETAAQVRSEDPRWRLVFPATRTTRDFLVGQFPMLQLAYWMAIFLIYLSEHIEGKVDPQLVHLWFAESAGSFAARWVLCLPVAKASPVTVAKQPLLRLLPLIAIVLAAAHWSWTAFIFIGVSLDLTTLVVLLSFVMLSVCAIGVAPASPTIGIVYLLPPWVVTTYKLLHADWVSGGALVVLGAALAALLWSAFVVGGVRKHLVRGDEVALLVAELRERNAEVEGLRAAAAKALATRSAFFTSASHDFRQRVHALKLLAHSAQFDSAAPGRDQSPMVRLAGIVEDLETYMTDVLEFARLESVSLDADRESVRLQDIFQRIDVQFEDVAAERKVDLRIRVTAVSVRTDAAMLVRILENLVSNAIKFTRGRVLLSARRYLGDVRIEVRDQGAGIAPACVERVFDAFYQVHHVAGDTGDGVGLGLAIVKRLTDALGYRIEVISRPDRGTLMRLIVPSADVIG